MVGCAAVGVLPDLLGLDHRSPFAQLVSFRPAMLGRAGRRRRRRDRGAPSCAGAGWTLAVGLPSWRWSAARWCCRGRLPAVDVPEPRRAGRTHADRAGVQHLRGRGGRRRRRRADPLEPPRPRRAAGGGRPLPGPARPAASRGYRFARLAASAAATCRASPPPCAADLGDVAVHDRPDDDGSRRSRSPAAALGDLRFVAFHSVAPVPGRRPAVALRPGHAGRAGARTGRPARRSSPATSTPPWTTRRFRDGIGRVRGRGRADRARAWSATWPTRCPRWFGAQIDHVLVTGGITAETLAVHDIPGSDHRAVVTRLRLPA